MISSTRHLAVYEGIGVDPEFTDALINGDAAPSKHHERARAKAMFSFADSLLLECLNSLSEIFAEIEPPELLREKLAFRINVPWTDNVRGDLLPIGPLLTALRTVQGQVGRV